MKKLLLVATIGVVGLVSAKTIENQEDLNRASSNTDLNSCTVTITKCCDGVGRDVTTSVTSSAGDCNAAATVANQQWNADCMAATIRKEIEESLPKENP